MNCNFKITNENIQDTKHYDSSDIKAKIDLNPKSNYLKPSKTNVTSNYCLENQKNTFTLNLHVNSKNYILRPNQKENYEEDLLESLNEREVEDLFDEHDLEDESSDEDKWFPRYKECECCKGFIFNCQGKACINMRYCYCKMKIECDKYF